MDTIRLITSEMVHESAVIARASEIDKQIREGKHKEYMVRLNYEEICKEISEIIYKCHHQITGPGEAMGEIFKALGIKE